DAILSGNYESPTGMGVGMTGARRLMDHLDVQSSPGQGTIVRLKKMLPRTARRFTAQEAAQLCREVEGEVARNPFEELQRQNRELLAALEELKKRGEELETLNRELEDTNRGVVALYAEL